MKKKLIILPVLILSLGFSSLGQAQINIKVNNEITDLNMKVFINQGTTFISTDELSEKFDIDVENHKDSKSFVFRRKDNYMAFNVDEKIVNINGKNKILEIPTVVKDGKIFISMRSILENLGYIVEWKNDTKEIKVHESENNGVINQTQKISPVKYIAHAGGRINDLDYTNSKEAIEHSYKNGHRLIELDMCWTTDNNLALVHDWGNFSRFINSSENRAYSSKEFKSFKIYNKLTTMTIDDLAIWLEKNQGVSIITDIKLNNVKALELIRNKYPNLLDRFVPQIYNFEEYNSVQNLGYKNIILTMYASDYTDSEILGFAKTHKLFALTIPVYRAKSELPSELLKEGIFTYTHTINSIDEVKNLEGFNIKGFYTDALMP